MLDAEEGRACATEIFTSQASLAMGSVSSARSTAKQLRLLNNGNTIQLLHQAWVCTLSMPAAHLDVGLLQSYFIYWLSLKSITIN